MRRVGLLFFLIIGLYLFTSAQQKEDKKDLPKIEEQILVTASKTPLLKSEATRSVLVLEREEIEALPISTAEELLKFISGFDFQSRGAFGLQVDPSLRAGSFEQTLILIDGVKFTDPQTGHNTLNLPLTLDDVERVEILKGPGSRLFGPNAFTGIINIITRQSRQNSFDLGIKAGQHNFQEIKTGLDLAASHFKNLFSFSTRKSTGYTHNTDFNQTAAFNRVQYDYSSGTLVLQTGYAEKAFGANGFYSPGFPDQWEKIKTTFLALDSNFYGKDLILQPRIYWRHSADEFLLDRHNPSFYHNLHHNDSYGGEITASLFTPYGQTSTGVEWQQEKIDSDRLGQHTRTFLGLFLEHQYSRKQLTLLFGGVAYNYPGYGWKIWPGVELNYRYSRKLSQFVSYNQSFRLPTFTELYYYDPANQGNSQLKPEEARELEIGWRYTDNFIELETSFFLRKAFNLIDWVKASLNDPWRAENITKINTTGIETNLTARKELLRILRLFDGLGLSYVNYSSKKEFPDYLSKYVLSSLKNQLIFAVQTQKFFGLKISLAGRYFQRLNQSACFLIDGKVSWSTPHYEVFLEGTNLGNKFYYDAGFIPAPPRWLILGIKVNLPGKIRFIK